MADLFWGSVSNNAFQDGDFLSYTTEAQPLVQPKLSKNILKKVLPKVFFRSYVAKLTDFGQNQSDTLIIPKRLSSPYEDTWKPVGEFEPLPTGSLNFGRMQVKVEERGKAWRFTERAKILTNFDVEAELTAYMRDVIPMSVDRDILMNAIVYMDIVGVCDTGGQAHTVVGKSLAPTKTFGTITINQVFYGAGTIEGKTPQPMTMAHIRDFVDDLIANRVPSRTGDGYGRYTVILNRKAYTRLITDPEWREMVRYGDPQRAFDGYIGHFEGQDFILDESLFIDRFITTLNPALNGKAIAIFLGKDTVAEVIVKPEQVLKGQPQDFGRYMAYAVHTYRGEAPLWFASVDGQGAGGILVGA